MLCVQVVNVLEDTMHLSLCWSSICYFKFRNFCICEVSQTENGKITLPLTDVVKSCSNPDLLMLFVKINAATVKSD